MDSVHPDRQIKAIHQGAQCIIDLIEREKAQVAEKAREQYVEMERRFCLSQSILEKERKASQDRINDLVFWHDKRVSKLEKAREDDKAKAQQEYDALERDFSRFREDVTRKDALRAQELVETSEKYTLIKDELDRTLVKLSQFINEAKEARMQAEKADQDLSKVKSDLEKLHIFHNDNNLAFGHCWAFILAAIDDPTASQFSPETVQVALGKLEKQLTRKTYANEFRAAQAERDKLAKELVIAQRELHEASAAASSSTATTLKLQAEVSQSRTSLEAKEAGLFAAQAERDKLIQDLDSSRRELGEASASASTSAALLNLQTEASNAKTEFESHLVVAHAERDKYAQELVILRRKLEDATSAGSLAAAATLRLQTEFSQTNTKLEARQAELVTYRAERDKLAQELAITKIELTKALDDAVSFAGDTLQLRTEISTSRTEFASELAVIHAERDRLAQDLVIIKRELKEALAAASSTAADLGLLTEASRILEDQLRTAQEDREKLTRELAAAKPQLVKAHTALSAARIQTQKMQKNILELKVALGLREAELQAERDKSARDLVDLKLQLEDSLAATSTSVVDALKFRKEAIEIQQAFDALAASIKETLTSCKIKCDVLDDTKISMGIVALKARIDYLSSKRKTLTKWKATTTAEMRILEKRLEGNASVLETSETTSRTRDQLLLPLSSTSSSLGDPKPTIFTGPTLLISGQHSSTNSETPPVSSISLVASSSKQPDPSIVLRTQQPSPLGSPKHKLKSLKRTRTHSHEKPKVKRLRREIETPNDIVLNDPSSSSSKNPRSKRLSKNQPKPSTTTILYPIIISPKPPDTLVDKPVYHKAVWVPQPLPHWIHDTDTRHSHPDVLPSPSSNVYHIVPPPDILELENRVSTVTNTRCYIWLTVCRFLFPLIESENVDLPSFHLTPDYWRGLLSEEYWIDRFLDEGDSQFDIHQFWKYGDPCVFSIFSRRHSSLNTVRERRPDGTPMEIWDFAWDGLKALIYSDLVLTNVKLQFEATDDIVMKPYYETRPENMRTRINQRRGLFRKSWSITEPFEAPVHSTHLAVRRSWATCFHGFIRDWPAFQLLPQDLYQLDDASFLNHELELITFYLNTVARTLHCTPLVPVELPDINSLPPAWRTQSPH